MTVKNYNFGEKLKEKVKNPKGEWEVLEVWQTPKYLQSKKKAIEIIEESKYKIEEGDFWILMNRGGDKMCYTGLILSHNGCLKINAALEDKDKFKPECAKVYKDENGNIVMQYVCPEQGLFEFGEVSSKNCQNQYPYAMALKRLQDRVILKNSKIAFFGIYSDSESDEFKEPLEPAEKLDKQKYADAADEDMKATQRHANEELAARLTKAISEKGSVAELEAWIDNKAVKSSYNKLEKYAKDLFTEVKKAELAKFFELDPDGNDGFPG